ncbi:hypothetical protein D9757_006496 [Collybiopsis confluens]|uniref:Uncharacterized protein n=1 Tax=Collybiopsis confluens TaxID=2823264 RepID=A0A8H5M8A0_9AGAR|nr:hypothetical protein D9757_006496 [Collybiopsis confluens]
MTATPDTAVPRLVVVDDTDPSIQYSPSGAFSFDSSGSLDRQGSGGQVFNRTLTGLTSTANNGSLSYKFKGTFVRAMVAATGFYGWNCTVDNHLITSFKVDTAPVTNYIACDSAETLAGSAEEHTLDVNFYFFPTSPSNSTLWLDSIQYEPLPSDPLDEVTMRVHNSDPSVHYSNSSGGWTYQGFSSNGTDITGTSMTFDFNGTLASLYSVNFGTPNQFNATTAFYAVDGSSTDFDLPGSTTVANTSPLLANVENWPLFTTPNLSPNQHSLQVATSFNGSTSPQYLIVNYFLIKTNPANSSSPEGSSNSTSNPGSSSSDNSHHSSSSTPVGAIVGGVVGGVVAIVAAILIIYFVRRRNRHTTRYEGGMLDLSTGTPPSGKFPRDPFAGPVSGPQMHSVSTPPTFSNAGVTPSAVPTQNPPPISSGQNEPLSSQQSSHLMPQMHSNSPPASGSGSSSTSGVFSPNTLYVQNHDRDVHSMYPGSVAGSSSSAAKSAPDPSQFASMKNAQSLKVRDDQLRNSEVRLHTDSGVRLPSSNEREVIDVPPTYSES